MSRLVTARDNHITRWVLPTASRLLIEAACKDAPIRHLDEVVHIEMGQSPSGESCNQDGDGVLLIGGPADLGLKFPNATRWTNQPTKLCRNGDIVICVRATIGEPRWADGVYCLGRGVAGLRPLDSKLNSRFLFRIIEGNEDWLRSQGTGTTFKTISKVHLARIKVPIIPKHEQEQIGSFLDWLEDNPGKRPDFNFAPPLPESLSEQRRLVAKIEALAAKITIAQQLRKQSVDETYSLMNKASRVIFEKPNCTIEDVAKVTKLAGFEYTKYFTLAGSGDVIVLRASNVRNSGLSLENAMTIPVAISNNLPRSQLKSGDLVMTFIGAKIGDVYYIKDDNPRLHCGPNVAKITPKQEVDHLYLTKALQSGIVQDQIVNITKRAAQPSLSMKVIRQIQIPVPSKEEQRRIVAYLDGIQAQVDALKKLQTQTAAELDALLPAILDRAFKGQL